MLLHVCGFVSKVRCGDSTNMSSQVALPTVNKDCRNSGMLGTVLQLPLDEEFSSKTFS